MILFEDRIDAAEQLAKRVEESLDKKCGKMEARTGTTKTTTNVE